jgi:hypothetical protein
MSTRQVDAIIGARVTGDVAASVDELRQHGARHPVGEARTDYAIVIITPMTGAARAIEQTAARAASRCPLQRRNQRGFIVSSTGGVEMRSNRREVRPIACERARNVRLTQQLEGRDGVDAPSVALA